MLIPYTQGTAARGALLIEVDSAVRGASLSRKDRIQMKTFCVAYDLRNQRNYPRLNKCLEDLGAVRLLGSLWMLNSALSESGLRAQLLACIDDDDELAVIETGEIAATEQLQAKIDGWRNNAIVQYLVAMRARGGASPGADAGSNGHSDRSRKYPPGQTL